MRMKLQDTDWENIHNKISDKLLLSNAYGKY